MARRRLSVGHSGGGRDPCSCVRAADGALASPAIDRTLFRDGEVKRSTGEFGAWTAVCDEIVRLKQRFCSLKASFYDASHQPIAEVLVSTGDNGRPAAMFRVALGAHIGSGVRVWLEPITAGGRAAAKPQPQPNSRQLDYVVCDRTLCAAVWSLGPADIKALNAGATLRARITRLRAFSPMSAPIAAPQYLQAVEGVVAGEGFSQAVNATLK